MLPLQIPGGIGGPELAILLLIFLIVVVAPVLVIAVLVLPFARGWVGDDGADANGARDGSVPGGAPDKLAALRERVDNLETEVERLREDGERESDEREPTPSDGDREQAP